MFEPEIARRCLRCGAAARARAQFCQQCGQQIESRASDGAAGGSIAPPAAPRSDLPSNTTARNAVPENPVPRGAAGEEEAFRVERVPQLRQQTGEDARRRVVVAAAGGTRRESDVADDGRAARARRGERAAVLDEAATDPSLRFVLVAGLIFAVALVVLLLSLTLR